MPSDVLVLLVEDEPLIRQNLAEELTEAGFEVVEAKDGEGALAELEADALRFRALLTDIRVGKGQDGWDIARHARELVPNLPVVYISGDSAHEWNSRGVPGSVMVAKPFVGAQIITALATLLNQGSAA